MAKGKRRPKIVKLKWHVTMLHHHILRVKAYALQQPELAGYAGPLGFLAARLYELRVSLDE